MEAYTSGEQVKTRGGKVNQELGAASTFGL